MFPSSTAAAAAHENARAPLPPALTALFAPRQPAVAVVVKRKRVLVPSEARDDDVEAVNTATEAGAEVERKPRVFVVPSDARPVAAGEPAAATPVDAPVVRVLRRRPSPLQRPGEVVHIVPPPQEPSQDDVLEQSDTSWLALPHHGEYESVLDSLAQVKALVQQAESASRFRIGRLGRGKR